MIVVAVLISCLLVVLLSFGVSRNAKKSDKALDVVVARYEEDLDWVVDDLMPMLDAEARVVVYNKGRRSTLSPRVLARVTVVDLPNVGRCDHTYLHHMCETHGLPGRRATLFVPGSCRSFPTKWERVVRLVSSYKGNTVFVCDEMRFDYDFTIDAWAARDPKNAEANASSRLEPCAIRPFGKWFDEVVRAPRPQCTSYGGMFIASPRDVDRKPRAYYERIMSFLTVADNTEAGHYVERAWTAIIEH
jgi:hypothetical protein